MQVGGLHCLMMFGRKMLGVIVSKISAARAPIDLELVLGGAVL